MASPFPNEGLFSPFLARSHRDVLLLIERLARLVDEPAAAEAADQPARRQKAADIHDRLMQEAHALAQATSGEFIVDDPAHSLWFTQAVLLWLRFAEAGSGVLIDTVGTRTLTRFPLDLEPSAADCRTMRRALSTAFGWRPRELRRIERDLDAISGNLRLKHALAVAIAELAANEPSTATLLHRIYGDVPFRDAEVGLIVTRTAVFFCLPYEGTCLTISDFDKRPLEERERLVAFLQLVRRGNRPQTDRFPAFGYFDRSLIDPEWLDTLARHVRCQAGFEQVPLGVVVETFASMVQILPTPLIDQYLIHDSWGHGWEESLCDFEWLHQKLARADAPITPDTGPFFGGDDAPALTQAFRVNDGATHLDETALLTVVQRDLEGRIAAAMNGVVAEMLADLIEHKYRLHVRPRPEEFPSSSLLADKPIKLDLTFVDVRSYIDLWSAPYRALVEEAESREALARAFLARGYPGAGLRESIERAVQILGERFHHLMDTSARCAPAGDGVPMHATLLQRTMIHLVALATEIERLLEEGEAQYHAAVTARGSMPRWHEPAACIDLLVVALGWFYEQNRSRHAWHLDEIVRTSLHPLLRRLRDALAAYREPISH